MESEEQASRQNGRAASDARGASSDRAARIGRRAGLAIYLSLLVYVVSVGFATFILGIFYAPTPVDTNHASCEDVRRELATDLRAKSATFVASGDVDLDQTFRAFDERLDSVRTRCSGPETDALERSRHSLEITLHRFDRENASVLSRLGASPSPSNEETPR